MKKIKQTDLLKEIKRREDYRRVDVLLRKQNFKDFAEEMEFINKLPERDQQILWK